MRGRTVCVGMMGLEIVVVVQLLSLSQLDPSLWVAVYCFAISIPILASGCIMVDRESEIPGRNAFSEMVAHTSIAGLLVGVIGLGAIFHHFHLYVAYTFGGMSLLMFAVLVEVHDRFVVKPAKHAVSKNEPSAASPPKLSSSESTLS